MADEKEISTMDLRANNYDELSSAKPTNNKIVGVYKNTPIWKTVDFWMGAANSAKKINWRNSNSNLTVDSNILLIPDNSQLQVSSGFEMENFSESLGKAGDILSILQGVSEVFTGSTVIPAYKPQVFKDIKTIEIPNALTFSFYYGSAFKFDALEEVVKPVYALLDFFGADTQSSEGGSIATVVPPWPTKSQFIATQILSGAKSLVSSVRSIGNSDSLTKSLGKLNASLQSALNAGAAAVANDSQYNNLYISWGRFTLGPMIYSEIKYEFDMNNFDEHGWPISGKFTLGGIKSMKTGTTETLKSTLIK